MGVGVGVGVEGPSRWKEELQEEGGVGGGSWLLREAQEEAAGGMNLKRGDGGVRCQ